MTSKKTRDNTKFVPLVSRVARKKKVAKVCADGAYDSRGNFDFLYEREESAIRVKTGASTLTFGSALRR